MSRMANNTSVSTLIRGSGDPWAPVAVAFIEDGGGGGSVEGGGVEVGGGWWTQAGDLT